MLLIYDQVTASDFLHCNINEINILAVEKMIKLNNITNIIIFVIRASVV